MNVIEPPHNHASEAPQPPIDDSVVPAVIVQTPPASEAAPQGRTSTVTAQFAPIIILLGAIAALGVLGFWKRAALPTLLDLVLPYSSAIAFVLLGVIGAFFKDTYRYTAAKWAAVAVMIVFGFLMGVNTYKERAARAQEKIDRAKDKTESTQTSGGIIKSVDHVSGELKDFKDKIKPDEIRREMTGLRSTMEKVLHPPRATMLFTFAPYPEPAVLGGPMIPVRDINLPLNSDGSVRVRFTFLNVSDVLAETLQVSLMICNGCKFAKEPEGFTRVPGSHETERNYVYGDAPARGGVAEVAADIIPPSGAPSFGIRVRHRCKSCVLDADGVAGTIHIQKN